MTKYMIAITLILGVSLTASVFLQAEGKELNDVSGMNTEEGNMNINFGLPWDILNTAFGVADDIANKNTDQIFSEEGNVEKETISVAGIQDIKLDSILAATMIAPSPDDNIHLVYSTKAKFKIAHTISDGKLIVTADVNRPGNNDILKVLLPAGTVKGLEIVGGASYVHFVGQEGLLETVNIDVTVGSVLLENIDADTTVTTSTGTIRMKNDTVKSNISLKTATGVVDVTLGELSDDVSLYTKGTIVRNTVLGSRSAAAQNEKYVLRLENKVGGINIHRAD